VARGHGADDDLGVAALPGKRHGLLAIFCGARIAVPDAVIGQLREDACAYADFTFWNQAERFFEQ
jgi:hypothetical protein